MGPKLDDELFYKLFKPFFRDIQITSLSQIYKSIISFLS